MCRGRLAAHDDAMNIDTHLISDLARQHQLDVAADMRRCRQLGFFGQTGLFGGRRRRLAAAPQPFAPVVDLAPPRAGPVPSGRDLEVA